jgi:hypothetical protein
MRERPSMFNRFAVAYSCSFVRPDPEPGLLPPRARERDRDELDPERARERAPEVPDRALLPLVLRDARELEPLRDLLEPLRDLDEPLPARLEPLERPVVLRAERLLVLRPLRDRCRLRCDSRGLPDSPGLPLFSSSEDESISFIATPTAAGIPTPTAAPAAIFLVVDMPSWPSSSAPIGHPSVSSRLLLVHHRTSPSCLGLLAAQLAGRKNQRLRRDRSDRPRPEGFPVDGWLRRGRDQWQPDVTREQMTSLAS